MARSLLILVLICLVYFLAVRKFLMTWGATDQEQQRFYTGDSIVKTPATVITIATSVHAAPSSLWPWIAQMGQQKGGFYTYTWLENIFGCKLKNADRVHPKWQDTKEGDLEPVCYNAVKRNMPGWIVATIIPGKALVYRSQ